VFLKRKGIFSAAVSLLKQSFILQVKAMLLIYILHKCLYSLIVKSINKDTMFLFLNLLKNIELVILAISVVSIAALLYRKLLLQVDTYPKLSHNQTPQVASDKTNQSLTEIKSLIASQTIKLEYAINQLQVKLSKGLQFQESLLCLLKAFEEGSEAICVTDTDGNLTDINKAFLELFGYSIDELNVNGGLFTLFVTTEVGQELHNLILNGYIWKGEIEMRVRYGEQIQAELYAETIENQTSQVIGIVFLITNVTERKQVEAALKQSEQRLRLAMKAARMGIWEWSLKTRDIIWSHNLETVFGFKLEICSGNFYILLEYIHPDDHQKLTYLVGYAVDEHVDYNIDFRLFQTDGSIRWVEAKGQILYDETGQATRMLGTVLDITERKKAEELLRESEASNCALLEAIPDMLFRISREGIYLAFVSTNNLELPPASYLLGKHLSEVLPANIAQLAMDRIEQALNTNKIQTANYQLLMNGDWHQYEARIVAINTDEVLAIIRNISDCKQVEEELQKSEFQFQNPASKVWQQYFTGVTRGFRIHSGQGCFIP
jgi:PAS domain S-box-containing protein